MYKKILVPLDGSSIAEVVLPYARAFATALRIPVHLLQVMDPETRIPSVAAQQDRSNNILTAEREHNGDYLKEMAASFFDPAAVSCSVRIGKAAEVITEVAAPHLDTLIAMTTHGRSGVRQSVLLFLSLARTYFSRHLKASSKTTSMSCISGSANSFRGRV